MTFSTQVRDHFKSLAQVLSVDDPVWRAWRLMKEAGVKQLPVLSEKRPSGIITDRDILQVSGLNGGQSLLVKDAMSLGPLLLDIDMPLPMAMQLMLENEQQHAIVVENQQVCGLFSWSEAFSWFLENFEALSAKKIIAR